MVAPFSPAELAQYKQLHYPDNTYPPFIESMERMRPGCVFHTSSKNLALLLENEPVGTYLVSTGSVGTLTQAVQIKSESGMKFIHNVDPERFVETLRSHQEMTDELAAQARPFLSAVDSHRINEIDFSLIQEKFPNVNTVLFFDIGCRKLDWFIKHLIQMKQHPSLRAFITFHHFLGSAQRMQICSYLESHHDDPNWDRIVTALMRSLYDDGKYSTLQEEPDFNSRYSKFFNSEALSDYRLIVSGKTLHMHRIILAGASEYFSSLFSGSYKEEKEQEIEQFSFEVVYASMKMIYTGEADFSRCSLLERLFFAHFVQAPLLIRSATSQLLDSTDNSISLRELDASGAWQQLTMEEKRIYFAKALSKRWQEDLADCSEDESKIRELRAHTLREIEAID